jgi:hypothetical protein
MALRFAKVARIWLVKKLCDRLRDLTWLRFPISQGNSPDSMFIDKSMQDTTIYVKVPFGREGEALEGFRAVI